MSVTDGDEETSPPRREAPARGQEGNCPGGEADTREPLWHEEVPMTPSGTQHSNKYQQGTRKWQKKVNSILKCDKRFGVLFF